MRAKKEHMALDKAQGVKPPGSYVWSIVHTAHVVEGATQPLSVVLWALLTLWYVYVHLDTHMQTHT